MVLNHTIWVVTEKWFQGTSMFVEPAFDVDIGSWFCYRHRCVGAFDSDNTFASVSITADYLLEY